MYQEAGPADERSEVLLSNVGCERGNSPESEFCTMKVQDEAGLEQ
jgi:hypothetical protein